jgi:GH15 family glucan-1,4-alpha-glucosidase
LLIALLFKPPLEKIGVEGMHFVYSKVMCWVALDRALRLADRRSFPAPERLKWLQIRDEIYLEIQSKGWNDKLKSFTLAYGNDSLDASHLIMPLVFFMAPNDPRMRATIDAINRPTRLGGLVSGGLVYRYQRDSFNDGLSGEEGTFNMCTFWLIEALARSGDGKIEEARLLFDQMLTFSNHVGLYSEETSRSGLMLGNFPQALTHLALISTAFNLDRAMKMGSKQAPSTTYDHL